MTFQRLYEAVLNCSGSSLLLLGFTVSLQAAQPVAAVAPGAIVQLPPLAAHRAVYDLSLDERRGNSAMDSVRGRIVYDFSGNRCEGYALKFRQVTEMNANGNTNVSDMRTTSFEDDQGKTFRFNVQNYLNQHLDDTFDGEASRDDKSVSVVLKKPSAETVKLPDGVIFPTAQVKGILQQAQKGEKIYEAQIYDGSDSKKVYSTLAVIGQKIDPSKKDAGAGSKTFKELEGIDRWPVSVSYFDPAKSGPGEQTPVYSLSFELYANGISNNLTLDYGDFSLKGQMTQLEMLPSGNCP